MTASIFFFQAEDGIRDIGVTGVQTCALPICLYTLAFDHVALWRNDAFWTSIPGWLLALLLYDFCYYWLHRMGHEDRKSTRLNSSHANISYAVFCLKKKNSPITTCKLQLTGPP